MGSNSRVAESGKGSKNLAMLSMTAENESSNTPYGEFLPTKRSPPSHRRQSRNPQRNFSHPYCPATTERVYLDSRTKAKIKKERMNGKPGAEKWDWIYRLIFECAPTSSACESKHTHNPVGTQPQCDDNSGVRTAEELAGPTFSIANLPVEQGLLLDDFEADVYNEMRFSCDLVSRYEVKVCLNFIAKFRSRRCQGRSSGMPESATSSGNSSRFADCPPQLEDFGQDMGAWQPEPDPMAGSLWFPDGAGQLGMLDGTNWFYDLSQALPQALPEAEFGTDFLGPEGAEAQSLWGWQNEFGIGDNGFFHLS
ncbi:hypothetical protein CSOJ01_11353 [Colletotrichum sojae]|uniref:Uncharacterized protein n=1 Tax=Colletotrichum sojae TaxID=2175907 RepID=A0A8H6IY45_9PEZI|nr:hypothetical protein CSOJ01_11353 [Colletotrichum sojae]